MIKDILDGEADMAAASMSILESRSRVVEFSSPIKTETHALFIRKKEAYPHNIYIQPFRMSSWFIILLIVALFTFSFYIIVHFGGENNPTEFSLAKCFIYVYGAYGGFASRRWSVTPENSSAR